MSTPSDAPPPAPAQPNPSVEDFYARLGVPRDATADAVRAAYRDAVRRHPPERDAEGFKRVREAFETLDDAQARARYDLLNDEDSPAGIFARAERAMGVRDYANATHLFKRLLLEDPEAGRARNMLGLCFLYQGDGAAAAAQYDRLLAQPQPETVWLLNAGHAYREAKRLDDARRALAAAGARADVDQSDVALALANVEIDASDYVAAYAAIRDGLARHTPKTPGAVLLLLRRLDVDLHVRDERAYATTLTAVEQASAEIGWQQQGAYRLGIVAWKLITAGAFALAQPAAAAARRLQPDDVDYDALFDVAAALGVHDVSRARQLVRTHKAFEAGKWLHPLGPRVLAYCDEHAAYDGMQPIKNAPSLRLVNGIGTRLIGRGKGPGERDEKTGTYVSTLYFLVLFIPLMPLRRYRVRDADKGGWHFLGVLPLTPRQRIHRNIGYAIAGALALWIAVTALLAPHPRQDANANADSALPAQIDVRSAVAQANRTDTAADSARGLAARSGVAPLTTPDASGSPSGPSSGPAPAPSAPSVPSGAATDSVAAAASTDAELAAAEASPPAADDFEARRRVLNLRYFQLKRERAANDAEASRLTSARAAGADPADLARRQAALDERIAAWRAHQARFDAATHTFDRDVDRSNARGH